MVAAVASSQVSVDNQAGEQNRNDSKAPAGVHSFFLSKIQSYELTINEKAQNLRRLEAPVSYTHLTLPTSDLV